ncbi:MAG: YidC/Oxa1 family membrane protein insertase, partial [Thermoleophilia bacterium]
METMANFFGPLSDAFFWLLKFLHLNLGISWSWSIVLLTVIVRIILIPLTWRQVKSMRAMQVLAPQIKALQEKYKNDRELLNVKIMEFYRENKVSPFGSCLPLLLQLPVFFGLYYMLRAAGNPGGAFAPPNPVVSWLWIGDITKFDYGLMFLYIASQFLASWQMARHSTGQQKMMAYFMPIIVGIFMYVGKWPAGLFIYWVTSNVWTIAQQFLVEKTMPVPVAAGTGSDAATPAKATSTRTTKTTATKASSAKTTRAASAKPGGTKPTATRATNRATNKKPASGGR